MKHRKSRSVSLQFKISSIYIVTNLLVMTVNIILLLGINSISKRLDMVYQDNLHLNALSDSLTEVQKETLRNIIKMTYNEAVRNGGKSETVVTK